MARITSRQAQELMDAYAKVYEPKEEPAVETPVNETPVEDIQERTLLRPSERLAQSQQTQANLKNATAGYKFSGSMTGGLRADKKEGGNNNNTSNNKTTQKPVAQQQQQQRPATGGQPQGGTPVNQLFNKGGSDGSPAPYTGGPNAAQRANAGTQKPVAQGQQPVKTVGGQGNRQRPVKTGGIQAGKAIRGGLSRLGSLAGRAVGAAKSAAGNVGAAAGRAAGAVASGAKSAAGAVASGAKRVAGGVADAATGNMTDFDKRGGKPQGVARVVAGGIDKLTGDRTDLDKRGATPLNAGQRAQEQKPAPQAQAKPAATRPVQGQQPAAKPVLSNNSPAAKAGIPLNMRQAAADKNAKFQAARKSGNLAQYRKENPQMSGADRAKAMAKQRIAAKKSAPAQPVQRKVASVMDVMDSYDPMENLFDDTVQFLVSEGHAKDKSEAMSIMSESEFIDAFNQELNG